MAKRKMTMSISVPGTHQGNGGDGQSFNREEELALLAYTYWIERGCPAGSPEVDWLRAEAELQKRRVRVRTAVA